jgi:hypothetical protein
MIRFRINDLIAECNRNIDPNAEHFTTQSVADAIGVPRPSLARLTKLRWEPVTNSATIEALCRFFQRHHPDFELSMLFEFHPPLAQTEEVDIDHLYPQRAEKGRRYREARDRN